MAGVAWSRTLSMGYPNWVTQALLVDRMECTKLHDLIGSHSSSVHSFLLYQKRVQLFPAGAFLTLDVYTCTLPLILLPGKNLLKSVALTEIFCKQKKLR